MKQRMRVSRVRLGTDDYRVLQPDRPPRQAFLFDNDRAIDMHVDREAATALTMAWGLAARSRHSLIYLPMRANTPPRGLADDHSTFEALDLVLVQHSVQFPASRWRAVRNKLGAGHPHTATLPDDTFPEKAAISYEGIWNRENHDHLHFDLAARTLFVVGSPEAFRRTGGSAIRSLVTEAPAYIAREPSGHFCAELNSGRWPLIPGPRHCAGLLHIEYNRTWTI
ncbi:hypothetical protein [Streptosporangium subroseum]|uniref:hypothetical protein n=1 Tax=Streptosporangium subroseum TaxID=106412 RepID=UPI00308C0BAC|nr:hypothetical protein OHB15_15635 [Streptosporangium subroseum]